MHHSAPVALAAPAPSSTTGPDFGAVSLLACNRWLERAYDSTPDLAIRRLIDDVLDDLWSLGSTDGELSELVIGALGSVQAALELSSDVPATIAG